MATSVTSISPVAPITRDWVARLRPAVVFAAALAALLPLLNGGLTSYNPDSFLFVYDARRVLEGQVPFRDFFEFIGPGTLWVQAAWMRVFGAEASTLQALLVLTLAALATALYVLASRVSGRPWLSLFVPAFVLLAIPLHFPWPYHQWYSQTAVAGVLLAVSQWLRNGRRRWLVVAGVGCVVTGLFTQTWGGGMAITVGAFLLLRDRRRAVLVDVAWFGGGVAAAGLAVGGYFALEGGLSSFMYDTLIFPPTHMREIDYSTFAFNLLSWVDPGGQVSPGLRPLVSLAPWATYVIPLLTVGVSAAIVSVACVRRLLPPDESAARADTSGDLLLLCAIASLVLFLLVLQVRPDMFHLTWATLIAYPTLLGAVSRFAGRPLFVRPTAAMAAVLGISAAVGFAGSVASAGPARSIDDVARTNAAVAYVQAHTAPGDTVAMIGWGGETYFYGRQPALSYTMVYTKMNWLSPRMRADVEGQIAAKRPKVVIFLAETCCDITLPSDYGAAAGGPGPDRVFYPQWGVSYVIYTRHGGQ